MNKYKFYMDELKMGYDRTDFTIEAETYEEAQIKALLPLLLQALVMRSGFCLTN